jgi:ABC-type transport system involved in multi-copper enzyme maturation permease subunit
LIRAIRSELLKLRTTNTWWLMGIGIALFTGLALAFNLTQAHFDLADNSKDFDMIENEEERQRYVAEERANYAEARTAAGLAKIAASVFTSGQLFGVMLVMVMAAILVTNEFHHQTATTTFLGIPQRTKVIVAKFVAGIAYGGIAWVVTTSLSVVAGVIFFKSEHVSNSLAEWDTLQSMLLNLAVYALWAVIGCGLGVLFRSQIAAIVTGTAVYLVGLAGGSIVFALIHAYLIKEDWVQTAEVILPAVASMVMVTPGGEAFLNAPAQWVGAAVLIGYGLIAGIIGTLITRRRDIS